MSSRNSSRWKDQTGLEELLASKEKMHYDNAVNAMHEIARLEALRMQLSDSLSEDEFEDETATNEATDYFSEYSSEKADHSSSQILNSKKISKLNNVNIKEVYKELCEISMGLQIENQRLKKWDSELHARESHNQLLQKKLKDYEDTLDELIDFESKKRCKELEDSFEQRMSDVTEELKRTKLSFKVMKQANDSIRKQNSHLEEQNKKLEEKVTSFSNRISNLQRRNEILKKQLDGERGNDSKSTRLTENGDDESFEIKTKQMRADLNAFCDILPICLEWIADTQLKENINQIVDKDQSEINDNDVITETTNEKSLKVLQRLSSISNYAGTSKFQWPFVQFVYWSLMHLYRNQNKKTCVPVATYRRIGEEIYKAQITNVCVTPDESSMYLNKQSKEGAFLHSTNITTRMLSALIILKTLNQADVLARVLDILKMDTREDMGKEIFVDHHGSSVLIAFFKPPYKGLLNIAVDVLMQMTVESPFLTRFLESLSNLSWIETFYELFQTKSLETSLMEKISIVLQRLSKIKSNQRHFDSLQFSKLIRELVVNCDADRPFLGLNLRSILLNLNGKTPGSIGLKSIAQ